MIAPEEYQTFFVEEVLPKVPDATRHHIETRYPHVRVTPAPGAVLLVDMPVIMLVALTATGKTTTLEHLSRMKQQGSVDYADDIPTRREIADFIVIPMAQVLTGDPVTPVADRTERFRYTALFAQIVATGGFAQAYSWLFYQREAPTTLLSDGIRGKQEITHVLAHHLHWRVFELWLDPVSRLRRLSYRQDTFDQVEEDDPDDLSFLTQRQRKQARGLILDGHITPQAIAIMRAEARNYGTEAYIPSGTLPRYQCLKVEGLRPPQVAQRLANYIAHYSAERSR